MDELNDRRRKIVSEQTHDSPVFACDLSAIPPDERAAHQALATHLFTDAVQSLEEIPDGYAFRFPVERYDDVVAFVANERRCCPFFIFTLDVTANHGPLGLRITGAPGVKEVLRAELGLAPAVEPSQP